jgi:hypothetical protein
MPIADWSKRWRALERSLNGRNASRRWLLNEEDRDNPCFEIAQPATEAEIAAVETELGTGLPASFRNILKMFSANVRVDWWLPEASCPPEPFDLIFSGECRWNLSELPSVMNTYREWIGRCFSDPTDAYDSVWYGKFPFMEIRNGDILGIDIASPEQQPVVYLSHDDGEAHGYWLGSDFEDYVDRLSLLGCVGAEEWQQSVFFTGPRDLLQVDNEKARLWREWLNVDF